MDLKMKLTWKQRNREKVNARRRELYAANPEPLKQKERERKLRTRGTANKSEKVKLRVIDAIDRNLAHLELDGEEPLADHERPRTRADCVNVPRPCPFVGCRHNNYLEVLAAGTIKPNGSLDPWDIPPENSCSLDVAEREGGLDIRGTAKALGCSSTRVDQVMRGVEIKLRGASETARGLREYK